MDLILLFLETLWQLSLSMGIYILFGLLLAGLLHEVVPSSLVTKHLGSSNIKSVLKSTLFGIPLPVCSCGVVPLATSIKKSGASKGATLSFLISTPITGVDSMAATYGIFGWIFTIYRVISSLVIALVAGILTNVLDKEETVKAPAFSLNNTTPNPTNPLQFNVPTPKKSFSLGRALNYALNTLFSDIAKPLFWGLIIGALITVFIPQNLQEILKEYQWLSYLIVIAIAVPMYVCATASLPIAAGLMLGGVSAGAAFVFLSAGPATNTVTIGVVKKMLGTKSLIIYLSTIVVGSILFGLGLDYIFNAQNIDAISLLHIHEEEGMLFSVSAVLLWGLLLHRLYLTYRR